MRETTLWTQRSVKKEDDEEENVVQAPEQRFSRSLWRRPW